MSGEALVAFGGYRSVDSSGYIPLKNVSLRVKVID
jgi:hypothetical protein